MKMSQDLLKEIQQGRSVVIDLEMTGIPLEDGHRVVSVGVVELLNGKTTGLAKEYFMNPERLNNPKAAEIHGLSDEFLAKQPLFAASAQNILDFIDDAPLVHHCWYGEDDRSVDENFLNMELTKAGFDTTDHARWINIKKWAQTIAPDANSLNNMLDRFDVSREGRGDKLGHGALIDSQLTAELFSKIYTYMQDHHAEKLAQGPETAINAQQPPTEPS